MWGTSIKDRITLHNDQFLLFTVFLPTADPFAELVPGPMKRTLLKTVMIPLRSSTGCLCTVAQDQILFVQWCVWANLSKLWTSRFDLKSRVSRPTSEGQGLRQDGSLGLPQW